MVLFTKNPVVNSAEELPQRKFQNKNKENEIQIKKKKESLTLIN